MAAYFQKPRIVVEESPWTAVLQGLPDMLLAFHQLNMRAEEKEKDRQFQESKMYLNDLMSSKRQLQQAVFDAGKVATAKGIAYDGMYDGIRTEHRTSGSGKINTSLKNILQSDMDHLYSVLDKIEGETRFANQGAMDAITIDQNYDGIIGSDDLLKMQEMLGVDNETEIPESYRKGVQFRLNEPEVRKYRAEQRKLDATLNILKGWDVDPNTPGIQLDPSDVRYEHQQRALTAQKLNPTSDSVTKEILNVHSAEANVEPFELWGQTYTRVAPGYHETAAGLAERKAGKLKQHPDSYKGMWFRVEDVVGASPASKAASAQDKERDGRYSVMLNNLKGYAKQLSDKEQGRLQWNPAATDAYRAGTFTVASKDHKKNLARNLATAFSAQKGAGEKGLEEVLGTSTTPKWIREKFTKGGDWKNVEAAVEAVILDPKFQELLDDPEEWRDAFNWKGGNELIQDNFYKQQVKMFKFILREEDRGPAQYDFLKGVTKVNAANNDSIPDIPNENEVIPEISPWLQAKRNKRAGG